MDKSGVEVTPRFIFTAKGFYDLQISDYEARGDSFAVRDNGVLLGHTPAVPHLEMYHTDINLAFADPTFSHGTYTLAPGQHEITIIVDRDLGGPGKGGVRLVPSTITHCVVGTYTLYTLGTQGTHSVEAEAICTQFGLTRAQLTAAELPALGKELLKCHGNGYAEAWIKQLGTHAGAANLMVSSHNGGKATVGTGKSGLILPVLCQK